MTELIIKLIWCLDQDHHQRVHRGLLLIGLMAEPVWCRDQNHQSVHGGWLLIIMGIPVMLKGMFTMALSMRYFSRVALIMYLQINIID